MAPPSKLAVATSSVRRLVKEEKSYHKEVAQQQTRIQKLEDNQAEENAEFQLKQEKQALAETQAVLPKVREKIADAVERLEAELEANKDAGGPASAEDVTKAKEVVAEARTAMREAA